MSEIEKLVMKGVYELDATDVLVLRFRYNAVTRQVFYEVYDRVLDRVIYSKRKNFKFFIRYINRMGLLPQR